MISVYLPRCNARENQERLLRQINQVIATGVQYSVRSFLDWTATALGTQLRWEGTGVNEVGYAIVPSALPVAAIVRIAPRYFRPTEVETLLGAPTKAKQKLGWLPEITAQEMCAEMVAHDLAEAKKNMPCSSTTATTSM